MLGVETAPWQWGGLPVQMTDAFPVYGFTLVAKRKVLGNPISIGGAEELRLSQGPAAARTLGLEQVPAPCASKEDLSAARYLETFGY